MDAFIEVQLENSRRFSDCYRKTIVEACRQRNLSVASHDDATPEHAQESAEYGMSIAEFPTTVEAAAVSHQLGLKVLMGAPNVVRGGSHSGNVAATDLAKNDILDILSSDYYPSSLLQAAHHLATRVEGYDLPRAVASISLAPARAAGLADRGEIRIGLRADMLQASAHRDRLVVNQVWREGERVF